MKRRPSYGTTVSMTTREARKHEQEGRHYYFVDQAVFQRAIDQDELLEWEEVHGNRYGTLHRELDRAGKAYDVVLMDIDPKGGLSVRKSWPNALLIFLKLPSQSVQHERLEGRHTEDESTIALRMGRTVEELEIAKAYNHELVNVTLSETVKKVENMIDQWLEGADE